MAETITKEQLETLTEEKLDTWIALNKSRLIGSAIFTKQNTLTSKLVQWGERHLFAKCKHNNCFVPSHTGSIIENCKQLYIFDMKPPRASIQPLKDFLLGTDEDYVIVIRDFPLKCEMFSFNMMFHVGESYPYLSALRSVFTKRQSKWRSHCSEMHARQLELCGYKFSKNFNLECTPDELLHVLKGDEK